MHSRIQIFGFFSISIILFSCSGEKKSKSDHTTSNKEQTTLQAETLSRDMQDGLDIYKRYCLSCHQLKGNGVSGMYPPLAGNPDLKGPIDSLINTVLRGKAGRINVNGTEYSSIMAPHNYLTDDQVANVLNYLLNGMNKLDLHISSSEVSAIRRKFN